MQRTIDCLLIQLLAPSTVFRHEVFPDCMCSYGQNSVDARKEQVEAEEASLREWEKRLEEGRVRLHDGERLLNEREDALKMREEALQQTSRELVETRSFLEKERALIQQSDVDLNARVVSLSERERVRFPLPACNLHFLMPSFSQGFCNLGCWEILIAVLPTT